MVALTLLELTFTAVDVEVRSLCDQRPDLEDCRLCHFDVAITFLTLLVVPVRKCNRRVSFSLNACTHKLCLQLLQTYVCFFQTRRRGAKLLRSDCPPPDSTSSVILESVRSFFATGLFFVMLTIA